MIEVIFKYSCDRCAKETQPSETYAGSPGSFVLPQPRPRLTERNHFCESCGNEYMLAVTDFWAKR